MIHFYLSFFIIAFISTFANNYYPSCSCLLYRLHLFRHFETSESMRCFYLRNVGSRTHATKLRAIVIVIFTGKHKTFEWIPLVCNKCISRMPSSPKRQLKAQRNNGKGGVRRRVTDSRNYKFRRRLAHVCLLF